MMNFLGNKVVMKLGMVLGYFCAKFRGGFRMFYFDKDQYPNWTGR
jgi:hypothetical protein